MKRRRSKRLTMPTLTRGSGQPGSCVIPPTVTPAMAAALARRAAIEPDVEVRSQLACSAKRLPARDALSIVRALLARSEDARDIHLPLLLWWAIESKVGTDPEAVLALFKDRAIWELPMVRTAIEERLMRRFAAAGTRRDLTDCARHLTMAPGPTTSSD